VDANLYDGPFYKQQIQDVEVPISPKPLCKFTTIYWLSYHCGRKAELGGFNGSQSPWQLLTATRRPDSVAHGSAGPSCMCGRKCKVTNLTPIQTECEWVLQSGSGLSVLFDEGIESYGIEGKGREGIPVSQSLSKAVQSCMPRARVTGNERQRTSRFKIQTHIYAACPVKSLVNDFVASRNCQQTNTNKTNTNTNKRIEDTPCRNQFQVITTRNELAPAAPMKL
jgi:hypothetical protein